MNRILCTALGSDTGPHFDALQSAGFEVLRADRGRDLYDAAQLASCLEGIDGVVAGSEPYPAALLEKLPRLRVLARTGVGFDAIDVAACDRLGIVIATTPGVNHHSVAEHAIAMLMAVGRGFPRRDLQVREGRWERFETPRIAGQTLALLGLGRIGQAVATRAVGLGLNVIAADPAADRSFAAKWNIELVSIDEGIARADFLSLHLPVLPETRHIIQAKTLARMKRGAILINTSRGGLIDEPALLDALASGHLAGAGLDVFQVEPLPADSPWLKLPNVMLSGHVAGLDLESQRDTLSMSADTIIQLKNGSWPAERIRNQPAPGTGQWTWKRS